MPKCSVPVHSGNFVFGKIAGKYVCFMQGRFHYYEYGDLDYVTLPIKIMKNLGEVLARAGSGFDKAVKTTCFLADIADFAVFNEIYGKYFSSKPARSCVAVRSLPKGALAEVEVIAVL